MDPEASKSSTPAPADSKAEDDTTDGVDTPASAENVAPDGAKSPPMGVPPLKQAMPMPMPGAGLPPRGPSIGRAPSPMGDRLLYMPMNGPQVPLPPRTPLTPVGDGINAAMGFSLRDSQMSREELIRTQCDLDKAHRELAHNAQVITGERTDHAR